jgi:hypothetical protein
MGAAREHGILDALTAAEVRVIADNGYRGSGFAVPQRRRPADPETGWLRRLSRNQEAVNSAHARQRGPGERANAQLKSWKVLRKIRCPHRTTVRGSGTGISAGVVEVYEQVPHHRGRPDIGWVRGAAEDVCGAWRVRWHLQPSAASRRGVRGRTVSPNASS